MIVLLLWSSVDIVRGKGRSYSSWEKGFLLVLTFYFASALMTTLVTADKFSSLDIPSRFLLWIPIYILVRHNRVNTAHVFLSTAAGLIVTTAIAAYEFFVLKTGRSGVGMNQIEFGNACLMLGAFLVGGLYKEKKLVIRIILAIGIFCAMAASLMSGSRGGWLALPVCAIFTIFWFRDYISSRQIAYGFVGLTMIIISIVLLPSVNDRISHGVRELARYDFSDENTRKGSIGIRLDLWRGGFSLFKEQPLLGTGNEGYQLKKFNLYEQKLYLYEQTKFVSLHSQYVEALTKRGLLGLVAFLAILLMPFGYFFFNRQLPYSLSGGLIIIIVSVAGLTQHVFSHNRGALLYLTLIGLTFALNEKNRIASQLKVKRVLIYTPSTEVSDKHSTAFRGEKVAKVKEKTPE